MGSPRHARLLFYTGSLLNDETSQNERFDLLWLRPYGAHLRNYTDLPWHAAIAVTSAKWKQQSLNEIDRDFPAVIRTRKRVIFLCVLVLLAPLTAQAKDAVIHFSFLPAPARGICISRFELSVFDDGQVLYEGHACVCEEGKHTLRIEPAKVAEWLASFERSGFANLPERVKSMAQDVREFELRVSAAGKSHTVRMPELHPDLPEAVQLVVRDILNSIRPYERWVNRRGAANCP
jgi:hypothetical protein